MADSPIEKAEEAVCDAIVKAAKERGRTPDELNQLSFAIQHMKWGPQGGDYHREGRDTDSMDYHTTNHGGEDRDRPAAGFGD